MRKTCAAALLCLLVGNTGQAHTATSMSVVCEDFKGVALGPRWIAVSNGGSLSLGRDGLTLSGSGSRFPFVENAWPLVPSGDFTLACKLRYNSVAARGTGLHIGVGLPSGTTNDCTGESVPGFRLWQDAGSGGLRTAASLTSPCTEASTTLAPAGDLLWHRYQFDRVGRSYTLRVDGAVRANWTDPAGNIFPLDVWFGSPVNAGTAGAWSSFTLDSLRVIATPPAATPITVTDFSAAPTLALSGTAAIAGTAVRLVPGSSGSHAGAAFWTQPVPVSAFATDFRFRISNAGGLSGGGDGLTFCVRGSPSNAPGKAGGNLGYTSVTPSVAVEVDVYRNGEFSDPNANHLGIDFNGSTISVATAVDPLGAGVSLKNGAIYHLWIDYDGTTMSVAIAPDGSPKPPAVLSYPVCLPFALGVVGFTAGTADAYANHDILSWSYTPLSAPTSLACHVTASVVNQPTQPAPTIQPLPGYQVAAETSRQFDPAAGMTDASGNVTVHPTQMWANLASMLTNAVTQVIDSTLFGTPCVGTLPVVVMERPGSACGTVAVQWPAGDAVNAAYLIEHYSADYWSALLQRPPTTLCQVWAGVRDRDAIRNGGGLTEDYVGAASRGQSRILLEPGLAQVGDAVLHEFGHRMVIQLVGRVLSAGDAHCSAMEARGMDEGLADYFVAAYTGDSHIYGRGAKPIRDLHQVSPYEYDPCGSGYCSDAYYGARVFGGALWDVRTAPTGSGVDGAAIDRAVYDAVGTLAQSQLEPAGRTFLHYRDALLGTSVGQQHDAAIRSAFARHNITDTPTALCIQTPIIAAAVRAVDQAGQHVAITFTKVAHALSYRVYERTFQDPAAGLGLGALVADSLTDTTFTYTEADTSAVVSFLVTAIDSTGNEGPASTEVPTVTAAPTQLPRLGLPFRLWPNPTRGAVFLELTGPALSGLRVEISDVAGRLIRRLRSAETPSPGRLRWDGRDERGQDVGSGVYLVRVGGGHTDSSTRLVVLMR